MIKVQREPNGQRRSDDHKKSPPQRVRNFLLSIPMIVLLVFSNLVNTRFMIKTQFNVKDVSSLSPEKLPKPPFQIIKPPFRIVQIGEPRSGSTFQFRLLSAIAHLKSPTGSKVLTQFVPPNIPLFGKIIKNNSTFVLKTHKEFESLSKLQRRGDISVFSSTTSSSMPSYAVYTQKKNQLVISSMREIESYQPIFDLTPVEVNTLKEYMGDYEKIRQCCGLQMSKYEVLRLRGCDISEFTNQPDYPMCEKYDMEDIERRFEASPIPYYESHDKTNWAKPGDCARFNLEISSGKDFNGRKFDKCRINGMFAGKGNTDASFLWNEEKIKIANKKKFEKKPSLNHFSRKKRLRLRKESQITNTTQNNLMEVFTQQIGKKLVKTTVNPPVTRQIRL
mmetsp:Transcript_50350/g.98516  ORF Transcript_50350/g.98516 Transcript_50350/m.98516 type:complete len:391 (+) Transcript_50350:74-1246(+)